LFYPQNLFCSVAASSDVDATNATMAERIELLRRAALNREATSLLNDGYALPLSATPT